MTAAMNDQQLFALLAAAVATIEADENHRYVVEEWQHEGRPVKEAFAVLYDGDTMQVAGVNIGTMRAGLASGSTDPVTVLLFALSLG